MGMKKIGILTFWGVPNYGAFAQAYALNKVVGRIMSKEDVKHIAYLHPQHYVLYFQKKKPQALSWKNWLSRSFYLGWIDYIKDKEIKYPNFDRDWKDIPNIPFVNEKALEAYKWDILITGSDAIWEYSIPDFGNDIHLIGNKMICNRLISYAASFGDMNSTDRFASFITEGLLKYDAISVRDSTSLKIVNMLTDGRKKVSTVLDPTLLYDFKRDSEIPDSNYKNYILVYGADFSDELIRSVKEYAAKNKLIIIGAGIAPEWCDLCLPNIGPKEWIGLFKDAELVVTCAFHGLMFSINYEKKLYLIRFNMLRTDLHGLLNN